MKNLTLIDKAFFLKRSPLFSALDLDLLLTIADKLVLVKFEPKDYVFIADEDANRMYFVVSGDVEIRSSAHEAICSLTPGDFFGEESLFSNKRRAYEALCLTETFLLTLSRVNLFTIISECPSVAVGFLQVYASAVNFRPIKQVEIDK